MIMRSSRIFGRIAVMAVAAMTALNASAEVQFNVARPASGSGLSDEVSELLVKKTEQILTRNSAAAAGAFDVFVVEPSLTVGDVLTSSGTVREVKTLSGEFTLVARNALDGARYYSVTVPLKTVVKSMTAGGEALALAKAIRPTDAVFTRFVRTARENAERYFEDHCDEVIARATAIGVAGGEEAAIIYLLGVPASAPCAEDAAGLIAGCRMRLEAEKEAKKSSEGSGGSDGSEASDDPEYAEESAGSNPAASPGRPEIYVENPDWNVKAESAVYTQGNRRITVTLKVTYKGKKSSVAAGVFTGKAFDGDGEPLPGLKLEGSNSRDFPADMPIKIEVYIPEIRTAPDVIGFIGMMIDGGKVDIRNIKVTK